jgi:hypothetical protein
LSAHLKADGGDSVRLEGVFWWGELVFGHYRGVWWNNYGFDADLLAKVFEHLKRDPDQLNLDLPFGSSRAGG